MLQILIHRQWQHMGAISVMVMVLERAVVLVMWVILRRGRIGKIDAASFDVRRATRLNRRMKVH